MTRAAKPLPARSRRDFANWSFFLVEVGMIAEGGLRNATEEGVDLNIEALHQIALLQKF